MSAAHTPGPWEVKAVNGRPDEPPGLYIVAGDGRDLMRGDFCRSEADANLIAAAPELAEALQLAQSAIRSRLDRYGSDGTVAENRAITVIAAALAKAGVL